MSFQLSPDQNVSSHQLRARYAEGADVAYLQTTLEHARAAQDRLAGFGLEDHARALEQVVAGLGQK